MFARPSLRSGLAGSGAEPPSNDSGGRSSARHAEEPRGLRCRRPSSRCAASHRSPAEQLGGVHRGTFTPRRSLERITVRARGGLEGSPSSAWCRSPYGVAPRQRLQILRPSCWRRATASAAGAASRPRLTRPSSPNLIPSMARRGSDVHAPEMLRPGSGAPGQARPQGVHEEHHSGARPSRVTCFRLPPCCLSVPSRGAFSGLAAGRASLACAWPTTGPCLPG